MPYKCSIPLCRGNYNKEHKVRVFGFPKHRELYEAWIAAVPRKNYTKNAKVCELHFKESDFILSAKATDGKTGRVIEVPLKLKRLRPNAVPSQYPKFHKSFPSNATCSGESSNKRLKLEHKQTILTEKKVIQNSKTSETFSSLEELSSKLNIIDSMCWTVMERPTSIIIMDIMAEAAPTINNSIVVDAELRVRAHHRDKILNKLNKYTFPFQVNNINVLNDILNELKKLNYQEKNYQHFIVTAVNDALQSLKYCENINEDLVNFLLEQVSFLSYTTHRHGYSADILIFASLLFTIEPRIYKFIRKTGKMILPHYTEIQKLCSPFTFKYSIEERDSNFLLHAKEKFPSLSEFDKLVILTLDKINFKEFVKFKDSHKFRCKKIGGSWRATSAHVFMVKSVLSSFKDVIHILLVDNMVGKLLHEFLRKVIVRLEDIGFTVLCVVTDDDPVNKKAVSYFLSPPVLQFVYPHPANSKKPLFFLIDSIHLLKCVRNSWLKLSNSNQCFFYPKFKDALGLYSEHKFSIASLQTLRQFFDLECESQIQMERKLCRKALTPAYLCKQNLNLIFRLFNEDVARSLTELGDEYKLPYYQGTAGFITLILNWWKIVNVNFPCRDLDPSNVYQQPLTYEVSDDKLIFLHKFLDWLDEWDNMERWAGMISKKTQTALKFSIYAIIQMAKYCKEELQINYILTGKFRTDYLNGKFGRLTS